MSLVSGEINHKNFLIAELNKEELISDLLLPHARPVFSYSTGRCYFQNRLAGTGDNGELLDKLPNDIQDSNKDRSHFNF